MCLWYLRASTPSLAPGTQRRPLLASPLATPHRGFFLAILVNTLTAESKTQQSYPHASTVEPKAQTPPFPPSSCLNVASILRAPHTLQALPAWNLRWAFSSQRKGPGSTRPGYTRPRSQRMRQTLGKLGSPRSTENSGVSHFPVRVQAAPLDWRAQETRDLRDHRTLRSLSERRKPERCLGSRHPSH